MLYVQAVAYFVCFYIILWVFFLFQRMFMIVKNLQNKTVLQMTEKDVKSGI